MKNTESKVKRHIKSEAIKELENLEFELQKARYPNCRYPIKPKHSDANSNGLTKAVISYIKIKGFHAERVNSTGAVKDNRKTSTDVLGNIRTIGSVSWIKSSTQKGTSDISATIKGHSIKIEIKCEASGDRYQSEAQIEYQRQIEKAGGVYIIVRTFEQFYNWFDSFINQ